VNLGHCDTNTQKACAPRRSLAVPIQPEIYCKPFKPRRKKTHQALQNKHGKILGKFLTVTDDNINRHINTELRIKISSEMTKK
jgi:hypothetical protein